MISTSFNVGSPGDRLCLLSVAFFFVFDIRIKPRPSRNLPQTRRKNKTLTSLLPLWLFKNSFPSTPGRIKLAGCSILHYTKNYKI